MFLWLQEVTTVVREFNNYPYPAKFDSIFPVPDVSPNPAFRMNDYNVSYQLILSTRHPYIPTRCFVSLLVFPLIHSFVSVHKVLIFDVGVCKISIHAKNTFMKKVQIHRRTIFIPFHFILLLQVPVSQNNTKQCPVELTKAFPRTTRIFW